MNRKGARVKHLLLGISLLVAGGVVLAQGAAQMPAYVAGTMPDRRPADAPVIREAAAPNEKDAFHGIEQPYPASLGVFKDQGAWYTPFTRAGMTGPYDLRGYHRQ